MGGRSDEYPAGSQKVLLESLGFAGLSVCSKSVATLNFYSATGQVQATRNLSSTPPDPSPEPCTPDFGRRRRLFLAVSLRSEYTTLGGVCLAPCSRAGHPCD